MVRNFLYATAIVAVWSVSAASVSAQFGDGNSPNNLFSQYYTQPGASQVTAGIYPAPHWVPGNVGHSYYTYQPLMPHEMMYQHSRNYYNYYNTGGYYGAPNALNKTTVRWQSGSNHMGPLPFTGNFAQMAKWRYLSHRYCLGGNCGGLGGCASGHCEGYSDAGDCVEGTCQDGACQGGGCLSHNPSNSVQR
jgi:hypothetical protein